MIETNHKQHSTHNIQTTHRWSERQRSWLQNNVRNNALWENPGVHVDVPWAIKPCHESDPSLIRGLARPIWIWGISTFVGLFLWCSNKHLPPEGPVPSGCAGAWSAWMFGGGGLCQAASTWMAGLMVSQQNIPLQRDDHCYSCQLSCGLQVVADQFA